MLTSTGLLEPTPRESLRRRKPLVPNTIFATSVFVITEVMFFVALISAFVIIKSNYAVWSPPSGVVLPIATTAFNTGVLFLSGIMLYFVGRAVKDKKDKTKVENLLLATMALGLFFVMVQGYEWVNLIRYGMTLSGSVFGACFFLLIGAHAIHAFSAVLAMVYVYRIVASGEIKLEHIYSMQIFWYFIVGIWPVLYKMVYF
ncbi:MAG: cytochrome c oxidase subunit 3 [Bdellovibrionota bacterium]